MIYCKDWKTLNYETKFKFIQDMTVEFNSVFNICESILVSQDALISTSFEPSNEIIKNPRMDSYQPFVCSIRDC